MDERRETARETPTSTPADARAQRQAIDRRLDRLDRLVRTRSLTIQLDVKRRGGSAT